VTAGGDDRADRFGDWPVSLERFVALAPGPTQVLAGSYTRLMTDVTARELQNDVSGTLRRVEAGERLRVIVGGRPVAEPVPLQNMPRSMDWESFVRGRERWAADPGLARDLAALTPDTTEDAPVL
jgi:antitoxin (DNA-binding transcriptional repressor) of toxin-antitoxin stability system